MQKATDVANQLDRRAAQRYELPLPLKVSLETEGGSEPTASTVFETYTSDISTTGIAFILDHDFQLGSSIKCVLRLSGNSPGDPPLQLRFKGKIVRINRLEKPSPSDPAGRVVIGATIEEYLVQMR